MSLSANLSTPVLKTATGAVKNGPGACGGFLVSSGTATVTLYDGTDATGTKILDSMVTAPGQFYPFPAQFTKGLWAVISTTSSITFFI